MAEVVSKINTILRCKSGVDIAIYNHNHNERHGVSAFPCALGFPSLMFGSVAVKSLASPSPSSSSLSKEFFGRVIVSGGREGMLRTGNPRSAVAGLGSQMSIGIGKAQKWWEKGLQPNMKEITSAQDLVNSLLNAGDKLVVVDFFSPGCGGCRALHPKISQLAEMNPDVQFLQVNYEEYKSMCYTLNVHVLPFFRFYRGAHGRLCSFSCTNATIKKFKDALAKHSPDRCSLGPPRGLEEKELLALSANKDLYFNYTPKAEEPVPVPAREEIVAEATAEPAAHSNSETPFLLSLPRPLTTSAKAAQDTEERALASPGR